MASAAPVLARYKEEEVYEQNNKHLHFYISDFTMGCSPPPPVYCTTVVVVYPPPPPPPPGPPPPPPPPPPPLVPLELKGCTIDASIADIHAFVDLSQTFYNPNTVPASGIYTFSVLAGSAICGFEMIRGQRKLYGEVKDKVKAQEEYDKAVKAGKTAALGKEETKDIFSICVGNLEPTETITIKLSYINTLIDDENLVKEFFKPQLRFTVPRAYVQRYGQDPSGQIDKNIKTDIPFTFKLYIQQVHKIETIQTPIGNVSPDPKAPNTATVTFSSGDKVPADKDIIIIITAEGLDKSRAFIEHHPSLSEKTTAVALSWMPDLDSTLYELRPPPVMEYIVLVDRSRSMEGVKMAAVKDLLPVLLRNLTVFRPEFPNPPKAFFNIFSYGETATALYPSSIEHNSRNVDQAIVEIKRMEADMGKKDILKALQKVFESLRKSEESKKRPIAIYLMTDGVVLNVRECMQEVRQQISERQKIIQSECGPCPPAKETFMRVFTVGLGHGVSTDLCDGIARAGFGYSTYITEYIGSNEVFGRCSRLVFASQMPPIASDFTFQWAPPDVTGPRRRGPGPVQNPDAWTNRQAPKVLPNVFPFTRSNAYQILGTRAETGTVVISSEVPSRPDEKVLPFETIPQKLPTDLAPFIHVCAAKAVITDLEDDLYLNNYPADEENIKDEIIRVGILYQLTSRYTSFVVIDDGITVGASRQVYDYTPDPHLWPSGPGPVRRDGDNSRTPSRGDPTVLRELVKLQQSDGSFGTSSEKAVDLIKPHLPPTAYTSLKERGFGDDIIAAFLTHLWISLKCAGEGLETKKKTDEWLKENAKNVDVEAIHSSLSKTVTSSPNN